MLKLYYTDEALKTKIRFIKIAPNDKLDRHGICYMKPDHKQLNISSKSEKAGQMEEPQVEGEEPKPMKGKNLAEAEYENKATIFNPTSETLNVYVEHPVAEL